MSGPSHTAVRALGWWALAYSTLQHAGFPLSWLGDLPGDGVLGTTRWGDWLDLVIPYLLLAPAILTLRRVAAPASRWVVFAVGAVAYVQGHGIHLAANSVNHAEPSGLADLWDEVVGHYLAHAGLALMMLALVLALSGRLSAGDVGAGLSGARRQRVGPIGAVLALGVGLTWATNALEGGTVPLGLPVAVLALVAGVARWRVRRDPLIAMVVVAATSAVLAMAGYGLVLQGFPQPSG